MKLTDQNQQIVWQAQYQPFGKAAVNEDPDGDHNLVTNNLRFAGQYYDAESDLHYNDFRYYDPSTGRYISSDPIGLAGGINTYLYVEGNPINRIDPLGLVSCGYNAAGSWVCRDVPVIPQNPFFPNNQNIPAAPQIPAWLVPYLQNPHPGDWISQPNGNVFPGFQQQDQVCSLPWLIGSLADMCALKRCQQHDDCYTANQCNVSSWGSTFMGGTKACNQCNSGF